MKELKQYVCEKCGTVYANKADCLECEGQHVDFEKINNTWYKPKKVCEKYPFRLTVKFKDGAYKTYELAGDAMNI